MNIYEIPLVDIRGEHTNLEEYRGRVLLIVNVASECGLTPQYEDLQKLYDLHREEGLVVLGFPSNDFMGQEPGTDAEILEFCDSNYGVTFPLFSKITVKGDEVHPLYQYLTREQYNGKADSEVAWNFQKYLISREGELVEIFAPRQRVSEEEVLNAIKAEL
nr:glutathione peroxidase [Saprospiraceae bacterium]